MRLAVVVPYYNEERGMQATLDALLRQSDRDFLLVLVDNGSADGSADVELGVRTAKSRRIQRTRQHDGLAGDVSQHARGFDHAIGAVGHQHMRGVLRGDGGTQ